MLTDLKDNEAARPRRARLSLVAEAVEPRPEGTLAHDVSVFSGPADNAYGPWPRPSIVDGTADGTIDAAIAPTDGQYYEFGSAALISRGPWRRRHGSKSLRQRATGGASDLVSELREISGQVNRMMSQVEHAIDRLGLHAL
jgi:hypothetical protein